MKKLISYFALVFLLVAFVTPDLLAQTADTSMVKHGRNFVDNNGDGYNDNAPDHDGDGIPNGLDPDFLGAKNQKGKRAFVDLDGDGIKDNAGKGIKGKQNQGRFGVKDGTGKPTRPQDGTGHGAKAGVGTTDNDGKGQSGKGRGYKGGGNK